MYRNFLKGIFLLVLFHTSPLSSLLSQADTTWSDRARSTLDKSPIDLSFSLEIKNGLRYVDDPYQNNHFLLGEARLQTTAAYYGNIFEFKSTLDLGYDYAFDQHIIQFRELLIDLYPHSWWSIKLGRQPLTWGKGDLMFINDLFPKDYVSFFSGRDIQYLKAPSNAIKLTINPSWLQINVVYTPQFDPDVFITGERLSFYDQPKMTFFGLDNLLRYNDKFDFFKDGELAWRLQKNISGFDLAAYGYYGDWKSPAEYDPSNDLYSFIPLNVHGMSFEGTFLKGILAIEFGYYNSLDDPDGDRPTVRNSEFRWLATYSRNLKKDLTIGVQFYSEVMADYEAFVANNPGAEQGQYQNTLTLRMTKMVNKQRLELGAFIFYSITNNDIYLRPRLAYKITDNWKIDIGGNIFGGENDTTFWSQFQNNNNIYLGLKYSL